MRLTPSNRELFTAARPARFAPPRWRLKLLLFVLIAVGLAGLAPGQDSESPALENSPDTSAPVQSNSAAKEKQASTPMAPGVPRQPGRVEYVGPDVFILLDSAGRPQPVPGMTYEDFMAAWKQLHQLAPPNREPRFTIDAVDIDGQTDGQHAKLRFEAVVHLLADEPVEVPLGLTGAILQGQPRFSAAEAHPTETTSTDKSDSARRLEGSFLNYGSGASGFVARLTGRRGERQKISLDLLVPLVRNGSETTLPLNCPRALTSRFSLETRSPVSEANVTGGSLISQTPAARGGTQLVVAGLAGAMQLAWQEGDRESSGLATVLSAEGAIRVSIDGRSVRTDARLTVRSFGGSFDRFRIRLPRGAQLVQGGQNEGGQEPGYRLTLEGGGSRAAASPPIGEESSVALVELPEKTQGPVVVNLSTEQAIGLNADLAGEVAGIDVIGAVRQFGDLALIVADDWQARWQLQQHVRQVEPPELEASLEQGEITAAFQYDRQPWSLGVRVAPRKTRVHVTPDYELDILADEARLDLHLHYQVFGTRAFEFRIKLSGWELTGDAIETAGLVDRDDAYVTPEGTLVLPLTASAPRSSEITIALRRPLSRAARRLRLPMPIPSADSTGTGDLIVRSPAEIELLPDARSSAGLTAVPITGTADDVGEAAPFRFRSFVPEAVFVADRISRTQRISVVLAAQIDIQDTAALVEQRMEYDVRYVPIRELSFNVPNELALDDNQFEIAVLPATGGDAEKPQAETPLPPLAPEKLDGSAVDGDTRQLRAALPQPRLGRFAIAVRYRVMRPPKSAGTTRWQIPLLRPADTPVNLQQAALRSESDLAVALDASGENSSWKEIPPLRRADGREFDYAFLSDHPELALPLVLSSADSAAPSATTVERVWLQTWLSGGVRQDRIAFRFRTTGSQVTVELPPRRSAEEVEVLLNGEQADVLLREAGRLVVRLDRNAHRRDGAPDVESLRPRTLELRYREPIGRGLLTRYRFTPPQMAGAGGLSQVYWQVVLPGDHHVLQPPEQLVAASKWQWLGSFWGLQSVWSQSQLEEWSGASPQLAPTAAQNVYLFSGLAPVSSIELTTAPRWLIVLAASSVVLLFVLAWIYAPILRRGWIMAATAILLAMLALAFPTTAMMFAQASLFGVVLAVVAAIIARLVARPARRPLVQLGGSSLRQATPRPESIVMQTVGTPASTAPLQGIDSKS